ncbi:hypothetical protein AMTRI_Chr04g188500 [Amborella trichopoda]
MKILSIFKPLYHLPPPLPPLSLKLNIKKLLMILFYLDTTHLHQHKPHSLETLIHFPLMTNNQPIMVFPYLPPHYHPPIGCYFPYDAPNKPLTNHHILMTVSVVYLLQGLLPHVNPILLPPTFPMMFILLLIKLFLLLSLLIMNILLLNRPSNILIGEMPWPQNFKLLKKTTPGPYNAYLLESTPLATNGFIRLSIVLMDA